MAYPPRGLIPIGILPEISYKKMQDEVLSNKEIEMTQLSGTIVTLPRGMNFGFIRTNNLPDHIFYFDSFGQNILNFNPVVGLEVLFESIVTKEINEDTGRTETRTTAKNVVKKQCIKVTSKESDHENADKNNSHKIILKILDESFRGALSSNVFSEFEDSIFSIMKILGVQHIFRFPRTEQQGKSDGFFKVAALAVIYDCTLEQNYLNDHSRSKNIQIDNYVSALERGFIEFKYNHGMRYDFSGSHKEVWIITRQKSSIVKQNNGINVKQINIIDIIELVKLRLISEAPIDDQKLAQALLSIGSS